MWNRGGRSSALDRAQVLLSGKTHPGSAPGSVHQSRNNTGPAAQTPGHTYPVGGSVKNTPAPPKAHAVYLDLSDLSDLSSVSSVSEHGEAAGKSQRKGDDSPQDPRPQTSLGGGGGGGGGGGSRFLKKAPPPATSSSQSPAISKTQIQQPPKPRYASSSQSAALSRLALIEDRISSRKEAQTEAEPREGPKPARILASDLGTPPQLPASQSLEAPLPLSAQSSSDLSPKGKRFIKKTAAVAVGTSITATADVAPKGPGVQTPSTDTGTLLDKSRAANASTPLASSGTKPARAVGGVSLDSDEEDMRKLLGDSLDSTEDSLLRPGRTASMNIAGKSLGKSNQRVSPMPPVRASSQAPASPPQRGSPFRFSRRAQFSPSALSPSPSHPYASPSPPGRPGSLLPRARSPPSPLSSASGHSEVLSLEELFPAVPNSEDSYSERSPISSEDFKINVMTLDDLVPVTLGFSEETTRDKQLPGQAKKKEEEEVLDYPSDFESDSRTGAGCSSSQISERLGGDGEEEDVSEVREEEDVSEVREEASDGSRGTTEEDYSSSFSDTCRSYTARTSYRSVTSKSLARSGDSRSSLSRSSWSSSRRSRRRPSPNRALKEAAVQTQPDPLAYTWSAGMAAMGPAVGAAYMDPTPVASHTVSAETVEALSTYSPAVFALNDMLRQQLAMTRQFVESSRHLHLCLVQSLGPADYKYTTLEDTKKFIRKHKPPKLTVEDALEEVLQEMRDYHYI
ncbi:uncharacterized protein C19orf44 homolog [Diretmus argenteus]